MNFKVNQHSNQVLVKETLMKVISVTEDLPLGVYDLVNVTLKVHCVEFTGPDDRKIQHSINPRIIIDDYIKLPPLQSRHVGPLQEPRMDKTSREHLLYFTFSASGSMNVERSTRQIKRKEEDSVLLLVKKECELKKKKNLVSLTYKCVSGTWQG